ncbi:MAG: ATP-binding protein [Candidatus Aminicenantes bacterium]|nr:ATP-binding protein [Candidatus Aminicenantes bacterium]
MEDLSLHILDIAENSVEAGATWVKISLIEDRKTDLLQLEIEDNGRGMSAEECRQALNPFYTTRKTRRFGLGLPFLLEACQAAGGQLSLESSPGQGTKVIATFRLSHIDLKPLGDIPLTIIALIAGHPEIDWQYYHRRNDWEFKFDSKEFKENYPEIAINHPMALKAIRNFINKNLSLIRREHDRG